MRQLQSSWFYYPSLLVILTRVPLFEVKPAEFPLVLEELSMEIERANGEEREREEREKEREREEGTRTWAGTGGSWDRRKFYLLVFRKSRRLKDTAFL